MAKKIFKYIGLAVLAGVVWTIVDSIIRFGAKGTILVTLFPILLPMTLYDDGSANLGGGYTYYDYRFISGKGTPFDIKFYGTAKLMPKTFIIF